MQRTAHRRHEPAEMHNSEHVTRMYAALVVVLMILNVAGYGLIALTS
jgi:hypothetical protein